MSDRLPNPPATPLQRIFEVLAAVGLVGCVAPLLIYWNQLPDVVPTHFGFNGRPDGWGEKSVFIVVTVLGVLVYVLFAIFSRFAARLEKDPRKLTPRHIQRSREFLAYGGTATLFIAWTIWAGIQVSLGLSEGLGSWVVPAIFVWLVTLCAMAIRLKRSAEAEPLLAERK